MNFSKYFEAYPVHDYTKFFDTKNPSSISFPKCCPLRWQDWPMLISIQRIYILFWLHQHVIYKNTFCHFQDKAKKNNNIFTQNRTHHLNFGVFLIYIVQTLCLSSDIVSVMNRNEKSAIICVMKIISRNFLHIIILLQREV